MQLKDLKKWVNSLEDKELEMQIMYVSEEFSVSGFIGKIKKAKENLYCTHEDDPSPLQTKKEVIEECMLEEGEFEELYDSPEVPEGQYYIEF